MPGFLYGRRARAYCVRVSAGLRGHERHIVTCVFLVALDRKSHVAGLCATCVALELLDFRQPLSGLIAQLVRAYGQ